MQEERAAEMGKGRPRTIEESGGPLPLADIAAGTESRLLTGIAEFDRIVGGGVVAGSVTLVGGDPGIGKTTLLLQVLPSLAQSGQKVLYISGEESPRQIKMRCERLDIDSEALLKMLEAHGYRYRISSGAL